MRLYDKLFILMYCGWYVVREVLLVWVELDLVIFDLSVGVVEK